MGLGRFSHFVSWIVVAGSYGVGVPYSLFSRAQAASASTNDAPGPAQESYSVQDQLSLSQISLLLYGTESRWVELAEANGLSAPYIIHLGQKLKLKRPPTLSQEQGKAALLARWRKRFGLTGDPKTYAASGPETQNYALAQVIKVPGTNPLIVDPPPPNIAKLLKQREDKIEAELNPETISSKNVFNQGKEKFEQRDFKAACDLFRQSRILDGKQIPPWMFELRCLKELKANDAELRDVVESFESANPTLKSLPVLKKIFEPQAGASP